MTVVRAVHRPRIRSIPATWSTVSGPFARAPAFSSAWATERKPGMGTVCGLRAQIQARAPCASVRPPLVRISRSSSTRPSHSGSAPAPAVKPGSQAGGEKYYAWPVSKRLILPSSDTVKRHAVRISPQVSLR